MKVCLIREGKPMKEVELTKKAVLTTAGIIGIAVAPTNMPMIPIGIMFTKAVYAFVAR